MSLSSKIITILLFVYAVFLGVNYYSQTYIILPAFRELEDMEARRDMQRVLEALEAEIDRVDKFTTDWSAWDDMGGFIRQPSEAFRESNLIDETFEDSDINLMSIVDTNGTVRWSMVYDHNSNRWLKLNSFPESGKLPDASFWTPKTPDQSIRGVMMTDMFPMVVVARPILDSQHRGPIRGALIVGKFLDAQELKEMQQRSRCSPRPLSTTFGASQPSSCRRPFRATSATTGNAPATSSCFSFSWRGSSF